MLNSLYWFIYYTTVPKHLELLIRFWVLPRQLANTVHTDIGLLRSKKYNSWHRENCMAFYFNYSMEKLLKFDLHFSGWSLFGCPDLLHTSHTRSNFIFEYMFSPQLPLKLTCWSSTFPTNKSWFFSALMIICMFTSCTSGVKLSRLVIGLVLLFPVQQIVE